MSLCVWQNPLVGVDMFFRVRHLESGRWLHHFNDDENERDDSNLTRGSGANLPQQASGPTAGVSQQSRTKLAERLSGRRRGGSNSGGRASVAGLLESNTLEKLVDSSMGITKEGYKTLKGSPERHDEDVFGFQVMHASKNSAQSP